MSYVIFCFLCLLNMLLHLSKYMFIPILDSRGYTLSLVSFHSPFQWQLRPTIPFEWPLMFHMKNLDFPQSSLKASLIGDLNHQTFDFLSGLYNNDDILFKNLFILHPRRCFTFIVVLIAASYTAMQACYFNRPFNN